jgi:hypothetical protein
MLLVFAVLLVTKKNPRVIEQKISSVHGALLYLKGTVS